MIRGAIVIAVVISSVYALSAQAAELPRWHGFVEQAYAGRISQDRLTKHQDYNLLEQRVQLKTRYAIQGENLLSHWNSVATYKGDFLLDEYFDTTGSYEVRELNLVFSPTRIIDIKAGRQVLTWGTGDYLFINDLFPKDYISFYIGRDDEYLKKPSDALRISLYPKTVNIDFVFIPYFTSNTMPEGDRLSFFDSFRRPPIKGWRPKRPLIFRRTAARPRAARGVPAGRPGRCLPAPRRRRPLQPSGSCAGSAA